MLKIFKNVAISLFYYPENAYHVVSYKKKNKINIYVYDRQYRDRSINLSIEIINRGGSNGSRKKRG